MDNFKINLIFNKIPLLFGRRENREISMAIPLE
jgi:hypothetical protein